LFLTFCLPAKKIKGPAVLIISLALTVSMIHKEGSLTFLDVGQGDSAVLMTKEGRVAVIDGGGTYSAECCSLC
jgi:beta-lactamase superfamily II metal-dependent hydrolase